MIIETNAGQLFQVTEPKFSGLSHCYLGLEVKRSKLGGYIAKVSAKEILVRKAGTKVIAA